MADLRIIEHSMVFHPEVIPGLYKVHRRRTPVEHKPGETDTRLRVLSIKYLEVHGRLAIQYFDPYKGITPIILENFPESAIGRHTNVNAWRFNLLTSQLVPAE